MPKKSAGLLLFRETSGALEVLLVHPGGKLVLAWALRGDLDPDRIRSNTFALEWPPKSGRIQNFPEVDRAGWFPIEIARRKILKGQAGFLDQLQAMAD